MEVDDPLELWKSDEAWDKFPGQIILCPLSRDELNAYYGLTNSQAEAAGVSMQQWEEEQAALLEDLHNPKLTKKRGKDGQPKMQPKQASSIRNLLKSQHEFAGFACLFLGLEPTLALVMQPLVAAKFFGFLLAKGQAQGRQLHGVRGSIIHHCSQMSETVEFVTSGEWGWAQPWAADEACMVKAWYANARAQAKVARHLATYATSTPARLTYHQALVAINTKWEEFLAAFEVSLAEMVEGWVRRLACGWWG